MKTIRINDRRMWGRLVVCLLSVCLLAGFFGETAAAKEYKVYFSETGEEGEWVEVYHGNFSQDFRTDVIEPSVIMQAKYIKIVGISRTTNYGYSIFEVELYGI